MTHSQAVMIDGNLRIFTSRKYRVTDMNPTEILGSYKVIATGLHYPGDDDENIEDRYTECLVIEVNVTGPFDPGTNIEQAIRDTFAYNGCQHEYDCCGCRSRYASKPTHIRDNLWYVEVHASRNY